MLSTPTTTSTPIIASTTAQSDIHRSVSNYYNDEHGIESNYQVNVGGRDGEYYYDDLGVNIVGEEPTRSVLTRSTTSTGPLQTGSGSHSTQLEFNVNNNYLVGRLSRDHGQGNEYEQRPIVDIYNVPTESPINPRTSLTTTAKPSTTTTVHQIQETTIYNQGSQPVLNRGKRAHDL